MHTNQRVTPDEPRFSDALTTKNLLHKFKDEIFIYSYFEFSVIYLSLYEEVSLGTYV